MPGNTVCGARFKASTAAHRARQILDYHLARKAACHWTIGPASQPANLGSVIGALGFRCRIHCAGMVCALSERKAASASAPGVKVHLAHEPFLFEPLTTPRRKRALAIRKGMRNYCMRNYWMRNHWMYGAWMNGKPVGHAVLFAGESEAGIYDIEVLPEVRGRGIAGKLMSLALDHAADLGHSHAVLAATGAGKSVYEKLGFRETAKIGFWMYGTMRQQ